MHVDSSSSKKRTTSALRGYDSIFLRRTSSPSCASFSAGTWIRGSKRIANFRTSKPTTVLLLPALNDMFDIVSTRAMATRMHPPPIVFVMLVALILAGAALVGYGMAGGKSRNWLHILGFATVMTLTAYVIIDLEYPRFGLIRVDAADQMLLELRETMR
jgi:hypothetical protein